MMPSTVPRILASASSWWPASAAVLMCRGIIHLLNRWLVIAGPAGQRSNLDDAETKPDEIASLRSQ
jgi:hypothetical protein